MVFWPYGRTHRVVILYGAHHAHPHRNRCEQSLDRLTHRSVWQSEIPHDLPSLRDGIGSYGTAHRFVRCEYGFPHRNLCE